MNYYTLQLILTTNNAVHIHSSEATQRQDEHVTVCQCQFTDQQVQKSSCQHLTL